MSGTDWAAIIVAGTGLVVALGKGVAWLINFVTARGDKAIEELEERDLKRVQRINLLEETLRENGIAVPS